MTMKYVLYKLNLVDSEDRNIQIISRNSRIEYIKVEDLDVPELKKGVWLSVNKIDEDGERNPDKFVAYFLKRFGNKMNADLVKEMDEKELFTELL